MQDQKRDWIRRQRQEKFEQILRYVDGTLQYIAKAKWILQLGSKEQKEELVLKYAERAYSNLPRIYKLRDEDEGLSDLLLQFSQALEEIEDAINSISCDISDEEQKLSKIAGQIQQRIKKLLEETFD